MRRLGCLDAETVVDLVEGRLEAEKRRLAVVHADGCAACRELIAASTRALITDGHQTTVAGAGPLGGPSLSAGQAFGRYQILGVAGAGGMGVVYAAYDPQLDRRIALKLVRAGADAESQRARLLREARAIAKVAHPNVVAVHDAGTVGDDVYIAMEFIDGETLNAWRRGGEHSTHEKWDLLLQAGRGLAAAHSAGLVHRDFKPDNVLVAADGRVRVTDFGLARPPGSEAGAAPALLVSDVTLTRSGAFVGTPAYMAPEQMRGERVDARADLFSFCVTAWECLYGARPFSGDSLEKLQAAIRAGKFSGAGDVPPAIRAALMRGLEADPAARPASMDELLIALEPRRRRRWWSLAAAGGLVLLALAAWWAGRAPGEKLCRAGAEKLHGVWDDARRAALRGAIGRMRLEATPEAAAMQRSLDDWSRRWVRDYTDACEATHVRGEQSAAALDLRMECLGDRKRDLDAFVAALVEDPQKLSRAVVAVRELTPTSECANVAALRKLTPNPRAIEPLQKELSRLDAEWRLDRGEDVAKRALELSERARAAGAQSLAARAMMLSGRDLGYRDQAEAAGERLREATLLAAQAGDDYTLARALDALVTLEGERRAHFAEAFRFARYAEEVEKRLGDVTLDWQHLGDLSRAEWRANDFSKAADDARRGLALAERQPNRDPIEYGALLTTLALSVGDGGNLDEAVKINQRALDEYHRVLSPDSSMVLQVEDNLATLELEAGHPEQAMARMRRAIALREKSAQAPMRLAAALTNLGWILADRNSDEAEAILQRAITLFQQSDGEQTEYLAYPLTGLGTLQLRRGKRAEAAPLLERALKLLDAPENREAPDHAEIEFLLARAIDDRARARKLATHARTVFAAHPLGVRRAQLVSDIDRFLAR